MGLAALRAGETDDVDGPIPAGDALELPPAEPLPDFDPPSS